MRATTMNRNTTAPGGYASRLRDRGVAFLRSIPGRVVSLSLLPCSPAVARAACLFIPVFYSVFKCTAIDQTPLSGKMAWETFTHSIVRGSQP